MRESNKENPMSMIDFVQALKELTPRQFEVVKSLVNALNDVQEELKKVSLKK